MQVSQQLQQSQPCSQAALLSDAQAWAKQVAAAAAVSVGSILSIGSVASTALQLLGGGFYFQQAGSIQSGVEFASLQTPAVPVYTTTQSTCSLTVQFQLM
jgi:hypothetical protein